MKALAGELAGRAAAAAALTEQGATGLAITLAADLPPFAASAAKRASGELWTLSE